MKHSINKIICLLFILSFSILSCKDDDDDSYPKVTYPTEEQKQPFTITNMKGTLYFEERDQKWAITPDREEFTAIKQLGFEEGAYIIISNMKNEYKPYEGPVTFSGEERLTHFLDYNMDMGHLIYVYTIQLTDIDPIESNQ